MTYFFVQEVEIRLALVFDVSADVFDICGANISPFCLFHSRPVLLLLFVIAVVVVILSVGVPIGRSLCLFSLLHSSRQSSEKLCNTGQQSWPTSLHRCRDLVRSQCDQS